MPQPTPPAGGSIPRDLSSRGFMSCFTWGEHPEGPISVETMSLLQDLFFDLYKQAFGRLPIEDMPDLDLDTHTSGLCVGLLDPLSNIILNTISFLPAGLAASSPPSGRMSTLRQISRFREACYPMVYSSISILIGFMRLYFRFLNEEQAGRYLLWARGDLALAVLFVELELYFEKPTIPDPRSARTLFSFQLAATEASHPAPDYLARLSTLWLPQHRLDTLVSALSERKLTVDGVLAISRVLNSQATAPPRTPFSQGPIDRARYAGLGDGRIGYTTIIQLPGDYITSLRNHLDTQPMLSNYREDAIQANLSTRRQKFGLTATWESCENSNPPGEATCLYIRSLKMSLHGMIHGFYLKALAKFSTQDARRLVRAIVVAGHCYGPLDPVSNIIVTSLWYDTKFPFPNSPALGEYDALDTLAPGEHDILDTLSLLRIECRSFVGLVALFCDTVCEQSFHYTLKSLCLTKCDLSVEVQRHLRQLGAMSPNPFAAATAAAQHPQSSALAEFLFSLSPMQLDHLRHLLSTNSKLSGDSLRQICNMFGRRAISGPEQLPLNHMALSILSGKRSAYAGQQIFVREKIMQLLQKYAYQHPMEPKYELVCICGLEAIGHTEVCYHVNFMAATDTRSENTLFFAEFWVSYGDQSKKSFCCPVPLPCTGRCYYGEVSATKIVYPDMIDYFSSDVTSGGVAQAEPTRDTDFIFHDLGRDLKLIEILKRLSEQQKAVQRDIREELVQGSHCEAPEWWNDYEVPADACLQPATSPEGGVLGQRTGKSLAGGDVSQSTKDGKQTSTKDACLQPATSPEGGVLGQRTGKSLAGGDVSQSTKDGKQTSTKDACLQPATSPEVGVLGQRTGKSLAGGDVSQSTKDGKQTSTKHGKQTRKVRSSC
ncbi:hypothetical protein ACQ4PT_016433 [Festuca glaucescens]